ncbi:MAG: hypothetical protein ACP5O1_12170 [Phycisphaerae bacterium]
MPEKSPNQQTTNNSQEIRYSAENIVIPENFVNMIKKGGVNAGDPNKISAPANIGGSSPITAKPAVAQINVNTQQKK